MKKIILGGLTGVLSLSAAVMGLTVVSLPSQAGTIRYEFNGGTSQIKVFEPIGQSFIAEDALVEAGLFILPINPGEPDTDPILYQLFEGIGINGSLVAEATFNLSEPFKGFRLVDFSATPLTVGSIYTLTASIIGTSALWATGDTSQAPNGTGVCKGVVPCSFSSALLVNPIPAIPEPSSVLALLGIGLGLSATKIKRINKN